MCVCVWYVCVVCDVFKICIYTCMCVGVCECGMCLWCVCVFVCLN